MDPVNVRYEDVDTFLELALEDGETIGGMFKSFRDEWPVPVSAAILHVCMGLQRLKRLGNMQAARMLREYEEKHAGTVRRVTQSQSEESTL